MTPLRACGAVLSTLAVATLAAALTVWLTGPATLTVVTVGDPAAGGANGFTVGLRLDAVAMVLALLVAGVGAVVAGYSVRHLDGEPRVGRYAGWLTLTVLSLLLAVTAASLPVLAVGWVVAGVGLAALVGTRRDLGYVPAAVRTVRRSMLLGDAALVVATVIAVAVLGTGDRDQLTEAVEQADLPAWGGALALAALLLAVAGAVRSAQVPAHRWLPETAAAPTPVSALLHGGLVNGAGLLAVLVWPVFAAVPWVLALLVVVGTTTVLVGMATAAARPDVKGRLAASTTAQMGFMTVQVGLGAPAAALFHLVGHGLFKATLFLGAGSGVSGTRRGRYAPTGRTVDETPAARTARALVAGLLPAVMLGVLVSTVAPPLHGMGSFVLLAAATATAGVVLFAVLDPARGLSVPRQLGLTVLTLSALAVYALALRAFELALSPSIGSATGSLLPAPVTAVLAVLLVAAAVLAVLVDRAVRLGRADRLLAAAVRAVAPPHARSRRRPVPAGRVDVPAADAVTADSRAVVRAAVERASEIVSPAWPLDSFVATNPLGGLEDQPFHDALATAQSVRDARGSLDEDTFRAAHARGRVLDEQLRRSLQQAAPTLVSLPGLRVVDEHLDAVEVARRILVGASAGSPPADAALADLVHRLGARVESLVEPSATPAPSPAQHLAGVPTVSDLLPELGDQVDLELLTWLPYLLDEGDVRWSAPAGASLFSRWRAVAATAGSGRAVGAADFADEVAGLPARADECVAAVLHRMDVPRSSWSAYLARSLGRLPGWAAHVTYLARERGGAHGASLVDLLAIRLAYEWALTAATSQRLGCAPTLDAVAEHVSASPAASPGAGATAAHSDRQASALARLAEAVACLRLDDDALQALTDVDVITLLRVSAELAGDRRPAIWLAAYEASHRDPLLRRMEVAASPPAPTPGAAASAPAGDASTSSTARRPALQAVMCIDVRSEPLRRCLEAADDVETLGFAGFFAVPFRHRGLNARASTDQCPVLIKPRNTVVEVPAPGQERRAQEALAGGRTWFGALDAVHAAESAPVAPFSLAESVGWLYGPSSAVRTAAPRTWTRLRERLRTALVPAVSTRQALDAGKLGDAATGATDRATDGDAAVGFTLSERVFLAEAALRTMGLTRDFARLVMLAGHTGATENNPFEAAYDCGACGGNGGAVNARALARMLEDDQVRAGLAERGLVVPDDTRFVAGVHDTTRDIVTLLDVELVPPSHDDDVRRLAAALASAGRANAVARAADLPGAPRRAMRDPGAAQRHVATRAADWAQVRPEWGLAGNAAFIVGPRELTRDVDLHGRAFLHSYRWEDDADATALEVILTAPMVVAEWINTQYYFATVDTDHFGSGTKVVHNVVGRLGVTSGPRGDLRPGLPLQAVASGADREGRVRLRHEPMRLLAVVHAPPERISMVIDRNPILQRLFGNGWVGLAAIDPGSGETLRYETTGTWVPWFDQDGDAVAAAAPSHTTTDDHEEPARSSDLRTGLQTTGVGA